MSARRWVTAAAVTVSLQAMALMAATAAFASQDEQRAAADASVRIDPRNVAGGDIGGHFVGVSIEWTLIDRYMGPDARTGFANLLSNLGSGVLRIGGSSQDVVPFSATAPDTERVVTPQDLTSIRQTLDLVDRGAPPGAGWVTVLGTAMAPPSAANPWRSLNHAIAFVRDGVEPTFGDDAGRAEVAGIALGNEPDLSYSGNLDRYLADFSAYANADYVNQWPRLVPATSENIGTWQSIRDQTINTRWFWQWPAMLDSIVSFMQVPTGPLPPFATDHFYPLARTCPTDPYRCPSIDRLLSQERMDNFDYEVYTHAGEAARRGLAYRMDETNTAAGRGAPGVSDVAASATWTLDTLFNAACPQPPDQPGANSDCHLGAAGVNVHNAEVRAFFFPEEGNAYYNAIRYDPTPAAGSPTAAPAYYALLLFAQLAQGATGLRPLALASSTAAPLPVAAWELRAGGSERRVFLINKGSAAVTVDVQAPEARVMLDRMAPYDPTAGARTLGAPDVRIDGRAVSPDDRFAGLDPTVAETHGGHVPVAISPGEAVVITLHEHAD